MTGRGAKLLTQFGKLKATLAITPTGAAKASSKKTLTFEPAKKKPSKKKKPTKKSGK